MTHTVVSTRGQFRYFYVVMEDIDEVGGVFYHFEHDDLVLSRDTPTPVDNLKRLDSAIRAKT